MTTPPRPARHAPTPRLAALGGDLIGVGFLALASWFMFGVDWAAVPTAPTPEFDRAAIRPEPRRQTLGDPPIIRVGGYDQRCDDCHALFASVPDRDRDRPRTQHTEIELKHGLNDGCLNCHDLAERERLRLHNGTTVPFTEVARLCAQCHGPIYRDWERGVHGKTVGAWNPEMGVQIRYTCTNCHDPHAPTYPMLTPLPGPNTLRLTRGERAIHEALGQERNVLLRWSRRSNAPRSPGNHDQSSADPDAHTPEAHRP